MTGEKDDNIRSKTFRCDLNRDTADGYKECEVGEEMNDNTKIR